MLPLEEETPNIDRHPAFTDTVQVFIEYGIAEMSIGG